MRIFKTLITFFIKAYKEIVWFAHLYPQIRKYTNYSGQKKGIFSLKDT